MPRRSNDLPANAAPNSSAEKLDAGGNVLQKRFYGSDGRAIKNIDHGHDHTGVGDPHVHDWDWTKV
ncbi:MAG TPA: polymorphic toxin type 24 domain-containing protein, partial [Pirellulales bacterium]